MDDYIERKAALNALANALGVGDVSDFYRLAKSNIRGIAAAGVVEVVRCEDCIHRDKKGVCEKFRQRYPFFPEDDFYCGFGAKMDGNADTEKSLLYANLDEIIDGTE